MPKNILSSLLVTIVSLGLLGIAWGQTANPTPADSIAGEWVLHFSVENQSVPGKMSLKVEGESVTGTIETAHTGPGSFQDGKWTDGKLTATLVFEKHESIALTGGLKTGKSLEGEFRTEGRVGKWEAERPSETTPEPSATP